MGLEPEAALRQLPSVNALLERPLISDLARRYGHAATRDCAQRALEELRRSLRAVGESPGRDELLARAEAIAAHTLRASRRSTLRRVINATGVVVHTNLGRAPLARTAARAAARAGQGYLALEYDLRSGRRGSRLAHCEALLRELTGAEGALVVNNNAAALLLALDTTAEGLAVLVSRGEMIEIGGGFRVHEILAKSRARLVEVGATNKTHLDDYAAVLRREPDGVGAILKVHRSNFVQTGFVAEVGLSSLARLIAEEARSAEARPARSPERPGVALVYDLGSGCLADLEPWGLPPEPRPAQAVAEGASLVAFSGDKLLGGPQAGILVGKGEWIERAKRNPLTRALRVDKLTLAALEATLILYRDPERLDRIPVLGLLRRSVQDLRRDATALRDDLAGIEGLHAEVVDTEARVGGGSLPGAAVPGAGVALRHTSLSPTRLEARLRRAAPPVIGRIVEERLVLDLRSVAEADRARLARAVRNALVKGVPTASDR